MFQQQQWADLCKFVIQKDEGNTLMLKTQMWNYHRDEGKENCEIKGLGSFNILFTCLFICKCNFKNKHLIS